MLKYFWIFSFDFVSENEELPMKSVRSPEALRDAIIKGTRHLIAVGGMSNFSYPKLLAETGIVAPTVYEHFRNKEDLLTVCYLEIDAEIGRLIAGVFEDMPPDVEEDVSAVVLAYCQKLWDTYWNYLIADSDRTRFYWTFYHTEYYTAAVRTRRAENFRAFNRFVDAIDRRFDLSDRCNRSVLVHNLIDGTTAAAVKLLSGEYSDDPLTVHTIFETIFQPVFAILDI